MLHSYYGCDTGCCGHSIEIDNKSTDFYFSHPYAMDPKQYAENLIREHLGEEHVKDLDWENCYIENY